jgi:hypothetical protein
MKITINKPALRKLSDVVVETLISAGRAADAVSKAADAITAATPTPAEAKRDRRDLRAAGAATWASLLDRVFGR